MCLCALLAHRVPGDIGLANRAGVWNSRHRYGERPGASCAPRDVIQTKPTIETGPGPADGDRPARAGLGLQVRRGLAWKAASQATAQVVRTGMTIALAHLLTPHDFGVAGMVLVFSGLVLLLPDLGLSASLIQLPTLSEEDRSTAFWAGLGFSLCLFAIAFVVAPLVADFFHTPQLRWMFVVVSFGFVTAALSQTQSSLLWRRMEFRALELRSMLATIVSATVGIAAALLGLGAWSLVLQSTANSVTSVVAIWSLSPWKPKLVFSGESLRRMRGFSANVLVARFLDYGDRNVDNLLVGRFLGASALGIYAIGYSVIIIPFERLIYPVRSVIFPALASLQGDIPAMRSLWLRSMRTVCGLVFPAMAGVIVVCPDFVTAILGARWSGATAVIQILAWVTLIQSMSAVNAAVYQSCYRSGLLLKVTAATFCLDLVSFAIGLRWGVRGVAAAYALTNTIVITPVALIVVIRLLGCPLRRLIAELRGFGEATAVMALVTGLGRHFLIPLGLSAGWRLTACVGIGVLTYALMCWWREPAVIGEMRRLPSRGFGAAA